ncbi:hypothetical protein MXB_2475, partial [Myxobolus squamalis]
DLNERIRSLFFLRNIEDDSAAHAISKALYDDSELLAHEAAYILGQMKAGEAIAAIGDPSSIQFLDQYANDSHIEVSETCEIGRDRLKIYGSVDPAPPHTSIDIEYLESLLLDETQSLFDRYRYFDIVILSAMFALRNLGTERCVEQRCTNALMTRLNDPERIV